MGVFSLLVSQRRGRNEAGQVAVEAALVMPLFVFFILGILQMGLTAQARVMAKYAAYRAARVGAMNNADPSAIEAAAILHLLPVLVSSSETILPTSSTGDVISKFARHVSFDNRLLSGDKMVKTVVCGPLKGDLDGSGPNSIGRAGQQALGGEGSNNEVDFDDPAVHAFPAAYIRDANALRRFNRLRLVVQIQLLYRMPIPFANWVITKAYLGTSLPSVLMMPNKNGVPRDVGMTQVGQVARASQMGVFVVPINVSYAMRMQSNFYLGRFALPEKNECITYAHPG
ncbi:TadE family protein [Hyalangium versicolor]|uniref:TadE family protein n=1 Tax=Hyalangium versicolor TaxID=2861190 RepID=UPI001CC9D13E|nr:TadE family protein [Hyalangium versicolor]